jgi:predicted RNA-binding Zn-ribbon protein involved in translation (DUF1610 family)
MLLLSGTLSLARGSCPVCGLDVRRDHSFNGSRLVDTYSCYRCGPTEYRVKARPA